MNSEAKIEKTEDGKLIVVDGNRQIPVVSGAEARRIKFLLEEKRKKFQKNEK